MPFLYRINDTGMALKGCRIGDEPVVVERDHHADLRVADGGFVLCDLGSSNGTWVRGERVTRHRIQPGDRIRAGRSFFVFEEGLTTAMGTLANARAGDTEAIHA
jgi:pSer/pThr/pTyr-binding forkhead associated (FHA) protein